MTSSWCLRIATTFLAASASACGRGERGGQLLKAGSGTELQSQIWARTDSITDFGIQTAQSRASVIPAEAWGSSVLAASLNIREGEGAPLQGSSVLSRAEELSSFLCRVLGFDNFPANFCLSFPSPASSPIW